MHLNNLFAIYRYQSIRYLLAVFFLLPVSSAEAKEVNIPVQINYHYLQQALIKQLYTDADQSKEIWNDGGGCSRIVLTDPRIDSVNGLLRISNQAFINISLPVGTECTPVYKRAGIVETYHRPLIEKNGFALRFDVVDMKVYNLDKTPLAEGRALELLNQFVNPQLSAMRIDLEPMVADIKQFLPEVIPTENTKTLQRILDSLSFRTIAVEQVYLDIVMGLTVDDIPPVKRFEPPLTQSELERWEQGSQQWDAFLTYTIKQIAAHSKSVTVRETLLDLLIETRYDILALLSGPVDHASDPVKALVISVWERLVPVLRMVSHELEGDLPLHYLTFIVAGDILQTLDSLGPGAGLEISLDGLRRMARMLAPDDEYDPLEYNHDVDPLLRKLLGAPLSQRTGNIEFPSKASWFIKSAHASTNNAALRHKLNSWAPSRNDINEYLPLIHQLLIQTASDTQKSKKLDPSYQKLFYDMLLATAWQESCWRQYIKSGDGIKTIMSVSGDIGIMQVNRKVWRGLYDAKQLERDIVYNATAGSEILLYYLVDHALKKELGKSGSGDNLARASYGAYNGGPRHLTRYRKPGISAELRKIDESFWSKYKTIKNGDIMSVASCYGETSGAVKFNNQLKKKHRATNIPAPASKPFGRPTKLLQPNSQNFTIQLMSSKHETQVIKFMQQNKLEAKAEYFKYRHNNETWYRLIYGSYVTRKEAQAEVQSLKKRLNLLDDPWVRQISR